VVVDCDRTVTKHYTYGWTILIVYFALIIWARASNFSRCNSVDIVRYYPKRNVKMFQRFYYEPMRISLHTIYDLLECF